MRVFSDINGAIEFAHDKHFTRLSFHSYTLEGVRASFQGNG